MTIDEMAKEAYLAYGSVTDMKNYQGLPMPLWENLPAKIQEAWRAACTKVEQIVKRAALVRVE